MKYFTNLLDDEDLDGSGLLLLVVLELCFCFSLCCSRLNWLSAESSPSVRSSLVVSAGLGGRPCDLGTSGIRGGGGRRLEDLDGLELDDSPCE